MLFSILLLWILLYTHWLPHLEKQLHCSRWQMNLFLVLMILSYWIPLLYLTSRFAVHVGFIFIIFLFFYFFVHVREKVRFWVMLLSASTIAFTLHWICFLPVDWDDQTVRLFMFSFFAIGSFLPFSSFYERIAFLWGGCLLIHVLLLIVNGEMLNPVVLGEQPFLDFCWFAMLGFVLLEHGIHSLRIHLRGR